MPWCASVPSPCHFHCHPGAHGAAYQINVTQFPVADKGFDGIGQRGNGGFAGQRRGFAATGEVDGDDIAFSGQRRDYRVPVTNTGTEPMDQEEWLTGALPG